MQVNPVTSIVGITNVALKTSSEGAVLGLARRLNQDLL